MITFQNQYKDFTPRVDLQTLGNTFNTLEKGHQAAVAAKSELDAAIAGLDMDPSEDGYKQQLHADIQNTIEENTLFGNAYGALDNLTLKLGDIKSNGGIIGRVRNNKLKKEYDAKVDAMNIPDGMKQMYKEENPYYYKDGEVDAKTGRVKPGEAWKATTQPVTTVPMTTIQTYALQIAAKEAGGGESISFLDANGKEVYDASKSADGAMYRKVGTKYERLPASKIEAAMKVAIESIPGAKDSLAQDYRYERYNYKKAVKDAENNNGNTMPYVKGFTDKDGKVYTEDQWLSNKMNDFAKVAAYSRVYNNVDFGTALQNRRSAQAKEKEKERKNANKRLGQIISGTEETESNSFAGIVRAKTAANSVGLKIAKKIMPDALKEADSISDVIAYVRKQDSSVKGPVGAINWILKNYGNNLNAAQRSQLNKSFTGYVQASHQYKQLLAASGDQADALRFSHDVASGQFNNNNKYSRRINKYLNLYYSNYNEYHAKVGSKLLDYIKNKYGTDINGLRNRGIDIVMDDDGNYDVKIDGKYRNELPKFVSTLYEADDNVSGSVKGWLKNKFTSGVASTNFHEYNPFWDSGASTSGIGSSNRFGVISDAYKRGLDASSKVEQKIGIEKGTKSFNIYTYGSFGAAAAIADPTIIDTGETLQQFVKRQNEQVKTGFAHGAFDAGQIQILDDSNRAKKDISKNIDAKLLIQSMCADNTNRNKIDIKIKAPTGSEAGGTQGYVISFDVPEGLGNDSFKTGEHVRFVVSGVSEEEVNFNPYTNSDVVASNAVINSRSTGGNIEISGYDKNLGYTDLVPIKKGKNAGNYSVSFMGHPKTISYDKANVYTTLMFTLNRLKQDIYSGYYNLNDPNTATLVDNKLKDITAELSNTMNVNYDSLKNAITNYIDEPYSE